MPILLFHFGYGDEWFVILNNGFNLFLNGFAVLFLDRANRVITFKHMFQGGISETSVDIRIILKMAIGVGATGIICGHNHPSGNRLASNADIHLCKDSREACGLLQIMLLDNLIITHNSYLSFHDEGMM